jgi:hypothetical protein
MPHDGKPRPSAGAAVVFVWYRMVSIVPGGGSLVASMASAAPRRHRRDALGATRAGRRGWRSRRTALVARAAPRQGLINYGSFND